MATVTDDPLSKKVEMTNWEKVCTRFATSNSTTPVLTQSLGSLYQL